MTQKANPSVNRPAEAFKTAGAIAYGGHGGTGFVRDGDKPTGIAVQDSGIDETALNSFNQTSSSTSLDVTIDAGEAFVFGSWLCIDTTTIVTLSSNTSNQTVFVGWNKNSSNDLIIGVETAFSNSPGDTDQKIPLYSFNTDSNGVTNVTDERKISQSRENRQASVFTSETGFVSGTTLESDESLTIEQDESMVTSDSYEINGDAQIDGDLVTVSNRTRHRELSNVSPTDHLEVIKEYDITAQSGNDPAFDGRLIDVFSDELTAFDVTVAPTSGLNDTYAFNFDDGKRYNNGSWDVPLTVNWDEDPGVDLDLTVRIHKRT